MELSTYFRINAENSGQFERTLIIADKGAYVSYLEGCTAPMRDENQLHAAVVELVALDDAEIKYSTVQNWYPGDPETGKGGIYNFVTKRADCRGDRSKVSWTQVETGSAITWKYPSCVLRGDGSSGEFYSIAITNGRQQADTGTKMIHLGADTRSRIISKGICAGQLVQHLPRPGLGPPQGQGRAQLHPVRQPADRQALRGPHRALHRGAQRPRRSSSTRRRPRGSPKTSCSTSCSAASRQEEAVQLLVNGFVKDVLQELPDGVRRRGPEAGGDLPGGERRMSAPTPQDPTSTLSLRHAFEVEQARRDAERCAREDGRAPPAGSRTWRAPSSCYDALIGDPAFLAEHGLTVDWRALHRHPRERRLPHRAPISKPASASVTRRRQAQVAVAGDDRAAASASSVDSVADALRVDGRSSCADEIR